MIKELYGTLAHYREMAEKNTKEQVTKGFVCREDAAELVEIAVQLAKKRRTRNKKQINNKQVTVKSDSRSVPEKKPGALCADKRRK